MNTNATMTAENPAVGQSLSTDGLGWISVDEAYPCAVGEQVSVLFCSPGWGWAIVGMFTNFGEEKEWSEYDQQNDRYIAWDSTPPTLWMLKPEPPNGTELTGAL